MRTIRRVDFPMASGPKPHLRVAAYCRVSTDQDEQLGSYRSQQNYYENFISEHVGWILSGIYADRATGRNITHRSRFNDLMADCRAGQIDLIITKSVSRFGRNTVDVLKAYLQFELATCSEKARKYARSAVDLANQLTHDRSSTKRDASICLVSVTAVASLIKAIQETAG